MAKLTLTFRSAIDGMLPETKDQFIAPRISELLAPTLPDISSNRQHPLNDYISNYQLFLSQRNITRQCCFNFIQNAEAAFDEYCAARTSLLEYLSVKATTIAPYFAALRHFEHCLAHLNQAVDSMNAIRRPCGEKDEFEKDDGSALQRVNDLNNDVKHMAGRYGGLPQRKKKTFDLFATRSDGSKSIPHEAKHAANVPIWITNDGLEGQKTSLTYAELADEVISTLKNAEIVANRGRH